jgi:hypothetical protein
LIPAEGRLLKGLKQKKLDKAWLTFSKVQLPTFPFTMI